MPISPHPRHLSSLPIVTVPHPIRRAQSLPTRSPIVTLRFSGSSSKIPRRGQKRPARSTTEVQLLRHHHHHHHREPVMNLVMVHQSQPVHSLRHRHDQRRNRQKKTLSSHHLRVHHRNPKLRALRSIPRSSHQKHLKREGTQRRLRSRRPL